MANRYPLIVDSSSQQIKEFPSGDTLVIDNLQVTGTTTTLETATLNVEDKNITINYSTGDSSSTADGSGLTFQDAVDASNDATILWNATNDEFDFSHGITLPDSQKITFGTGGDLEIYHDGSHSYVSDQGTGNLRILAENFTVRNPANNESMIIATPDAGVTLYYDNSSKFATTSTGIDVTGVITTDGLTTSANINFGDSDEAVFGASSDFKIFHSGGENFIRGNSSASATYIDTCENLNIRHLDTDGSNAETMIKAVGDGAVELYHDNSKKLETTSTGVTVTGALLEDTNRVATNGRAIAFSLIFG